jgi:hypothetical protein
MGATVEIQNPVSRYDKSVQTDSQGNFEFDNIPYNNYHLSASAKGFQGGEQDVNVRSPLPLEAKMSLTIGAGTESVTVTSGTDLVETDTTTHTDIDRGLFDKLPLESQSSSLSSLATLASPGVSADSNGLFHGLGDHASNSFSIDGQPITDQQSKVFSNQLPVDAVQSMEVIEGAPPAEYGGKTSLVLVVTTRSGLGSTTPHGDITTSYGTSALPIAASIFPMEGKSGETLSPPMVWIRAASWTVRSTRFFTITATRRTYSTGSISSFPTRTPSTSTFNSPDPGSRLPILTTPKTRRPGTAWW